MTTPSFDTVHVHSVGDLVDYVSDAVSSKNARHWYRGHTGSDWTLLPSVLRKAPSFEAAKVIERDSVHTFRSRAGIRYPAKPKFEDIAGWLSLMQHYGLPTRLLDWSRSPLVATYFALEPYLYDESLQPVDACVWMLQPHQLNVSQGFADVTVTIDSQQCRDLIKPAFYDRDQEVGKIQAVMASETDMRMFVQQGAFTIHSTDVAIEHQALQPDTLRKIVVPASAVRNVAFSLAVCGFRKGDIYPDLQNLAIDISLFSAKLN